MEEQIKQSKDHPDRAAREFEALFRRALGALEDARGPYHPSVAVTCHSLAELHLGDGRYRDAEPLLQRALVIEEGSLGRDHPAVATTLVSYAGLLRKMGRAKQADHLEARAAAIREQHAEEGPAEARSRVRLPG